MFELNKKIENWHNELIANQSMDETDVNELIYHLKDNIEEFNKKGLSEEESYWIAKHRLGDTQALSIEFSKVNQALIWKKRMLWLLLGYFLFLGSAIYVQKILSAEQGQFLQGSDLDLGSCFEN